MSGKFEIYTDNAGAIRFRLKSGNGEIVGASAAYTARASAITGIESVQSNAADEDRYEIFSGENGKFYFRMKARNGEAILSSQGYSSEAGAKEGTKAVSRAADGATTVDAE